MYIIQLLQNGAYKEVRSQSSHPALLLGRNHDKPPHNVREINKVSLVC